MRPVTIVDKPSCCSNDERGSRQDPVLERFSDDLVWLREQGVEVTRINPSQDPEAFLSQAALLRLFEVQGNACLPAVLADGRVVSSGHYPARDQLARHAGLDGADEGHLAPAVRALVAVAVAAVAGCEPDFLRHHAEALKLGVTGEEMDEAVAVARAVTESHAEAMLDLVGRYLAPQTESSAVAPPTSRS
jgi:AhpD family alkylhydroperoxidase